MIRAVRKMAAMLGAMWLALTAYSASAPLNFIQEPAASGFYSVLVNDSFSAVGVANADDWYFEGEVGDRVSVRLEAVVGTSRPKIRLLNTSDATLFSFDGGTDGVGVMSSYLVTTPGTYRVRVYTDNAVSNYAMRVDLGRGIGLEVESNDTVATANLLVPKAGAGSFSLSVGGLIPATDSVGDIFDLGLMPAGSNLVATAQLPSSTLASGDVSLRLYEQRLSDRGIDVGGSKYATVPHHAVFDAIQTANAVTLEAWIYIRSYPSGWFTIFDKYEQTSDWGWVFGIENGGGGISFWNTTNSRAISSVTPALNVWHHVAVAYDHTANSVRFYLDGTLVSTKTSPGPLRVTSGEPAYIGFSPSGGDEYSDGIISEVRLWNRALTTSEIQANFGAADLAGSETNLVGLWRFDEGTGLVGADSSPTANNAILGGGDSARIPVWTTGSIRPLPPVAGTSISRSFSSAADTWLQISAANNRGISGRYFLSGSVTDSIPLHVLSTSFPTAGGATTDYIQSFTVTFDDELNPISANNLANIDLRGAGPDSTFGTADDVVYSLGSPNYVNGNVLSYALLNGPLQAGLMRLTLGLGMQDRAGNPLDGTYTLNFTAQELGGFRIENQSNDTFATATSLSESAGELPGYGGGWRDGVEYAAGGADPYGVATADFNGDGKLDLVSANYNGGTIAVLLGNGDGTFGTAVTYAAPNNPFTLAVGDVNGDGKPDVLVTRINGNAVRVFLNTSTGGVLTFAAGVDYATGAQPHRLVLADLNGDGRLDIATANYSANTVSILYGNGVGAVGNGTFAAKVDFAVSGGPYAIAAGKLNGDDQVDLAVGTYGDNNVKVYYRQPDGSYTAGDVFTTASGYPVMAVAIGDVNGDGRADLLAVQQYNSAIRRWHQQADGTLLAGAGFSQGVSTHGAGLLLQDLNGDGKPEVIGGGYYNLNVFENLGAGAFGGAAYPTTNTSQYVYAVAAGDFNGDGRMDLVAPVVARDTLRVFLGRGPEPMLADGAGTLGRARGSRSSSSDYDYYSFYAKAGDRVFVSSETPNHASTTGLLYRIYNAEGDEITNFYGNINPSNGSDGTGQGQFVASASGRYYVRVDQWQSYYGEYRIVVATAPGSFDLESEGNNSTGAANGLTWTDAPGSRSAAAGGILSYGDPGDWFALGFLDGGTQVTLGASKPLSSGLNWVLSVMNSAGTQVISSVVNDPNLVYTIPGGAAGLYYARIQASSGADFYAQYRLALTVADIQPPTITADTLPAEGSTVTNFFWNFTLSFSETLRAATVNNVANYELRSAGPDGVFGNGDDEIYSIALSSAYSSGLSASYQLTDGPPQPGLYRFQAKTGLLDIYGNPLAAVYTRTFTVAGVPPYIYESRSNDTFATATSLAAPGGELPGYGGGWRDGVEYAAGGADPYGVATADFNGDGKLDLVSANYNGGTIGVLPGNGDGTFGTAVTYAAPNNPFTLAVGDVNGDGKPDVLVTRINGNAVRVFLNTSTGGVLTFAAGVDYATGAQPHRLVLADLNGDGRLDIATANYSANTVSILYGNGVGVVGNGTFAAKVDFAVSGGPYALAAGKLNGDDQVDLAVGTYGDNNVKVYYRQLDGSYTAGDVFTTGSGYPVMAVAIGDVNGDGRADLLAVQQYNSAIRRWHQQADGTLVAGAGFSQGVSAHGASVLLQDLNGDGKPEVIVGGYYNLNVFENFGAGAFSGAAYPTSNTSQYIYALAAGDFNGDGRMDLVAPIVARDTLRVFLGRGPEPMLADGAGTLGRARGNRSGSGDYDYFSFYARAGDRVFVSSETPNHASTTGLLYRIYNAEGDEITNFYGNINPSNGSDGTGQGQFVAPGSGKYYVRVDQWQSYYGEYRIVVATAPGNFDLESEGNNSTGAANGLNWTDAAGSRSAAVGGILSYGDPGDWFALGFLDAGTQVTLGASKPVPSGLNWVLSVMNSAGTQVSSSAPNASSLVYTIPGGAAGTYYARIQASSGADFYAQYRLALTVADIQPPTITADTLPAEGSTVTNFFWNFSLSFSETLQAATVNNVANYELRSAGPNGVFDNGGDDEIYSIVLSPAYSSGLSASYLLSDGPPQPGLYRFQAKTGLLDIYGNPLAAVYTRTFTVAGVPPYIYESRSNDAFATATSLAAPGGEQPGYGGGWRDGVEYAAGGADPYGVATADFNGDGKLDLVSANYNGGTIGVLLGNGDGTFGTAVTYAAPNNPFTLAVGDVNGDGKPDVVVTRINGNAVRVFLNTSAGGVLSFAAGVDYATGAQPHRLALADLNGDGRLDIATANYSANTVSILYGNGVGAVGNGTFAAKVDFAVSGGPYAIAAGKLDGDDRVDLAVGTNGDNSVKVYYRQLDGSYSAGPVFTTGSGYPVMAVAIGDVNGDSRADLLAVYYYNSPIRRWHQQADGTLVEGAGFSPGGSTYGAGLLLQDLNGDGKPEVIGGGYYNLNVFENLGGGGFGGAAYPTTNTSQFVYAVAAGDFNGDGRIDLVAPIIARDTLRVFLGRGPEPMLADGAGTLARARGNRSGSGDYDYFSFYAKAGDRVFVSSETPNHAGSTGLLYRVYNSEGDELTNFYGQINPSNSTDGTGQVQFVAPASGKYYVRVDQWHSYYGEYRIVVATAPGSFDLESEGNNSASAANGLTWTQVPGARSASTGGIISYGDPGDWFTLGFLDVGTQVTLNVSKPPSSGLNWIVDLLNGSSAVVAAGAPGATPVSFTIPAGAAGTYYARVRASGGADFLAQYRLGVGLTDTTPPNIAASSLPAEGSRITSLFDRFTLTFSKDMEAATVNNPASYDLRAAGADATFDTADDVIVPLVPVSTYASGLTVDLRTANGGPLPAGNYRFKALPGLLDRFINALSPVYTRSFGVDSIPGYTFESEPNGTQATATSLALETTQPDLFGAGGRGYRLSSTDSDYWSFNLQAGDRVYVQGEVPGTPSNTGSYYQIFNPAGTELAAMYADNNGPFAFGVFTASSTGAYALRVSNWHAYYGEYRFRVYILRGNLQVETEPNNTIATASAMTLVTSGSNASGSMQGLSRVAGDLDYISLGTLQAGTTVFLSCRLPARSTFVPIVSLYNAAGTLLGEATGGRAGDAVAQVPISVTGTYYALVRTSGSTSGLDSEYILDALVVPTVDISFPNLQVTSLTPPPASGLKSGDATTLSFRVDNLGNLATPSVTWVDRVVLSSDTVYGNADDIELGTYPHVGPLNLGAFYSVNATPVTIPDGISGDFYVIARTDHTNTVSEFVLEGDNETVSAAPISIALAPYPDLVIEDLVVSDADGSGNRTATWTLANRGTGAAAAGFSERFMVRNNSTGNILVNNLLPVASSLAANTTLARQATFATTTAGVYAVEVTADAQSQRFEYNPAGHTAAELNNGATVPFTIIQLYTITVSADPLAGGTVAGGGTFAEGSNRTVTATANAPYLFLGWFEGAFLRSVNPSYTSPLFSNRALTARFSLPTFVITTQVNPVGTGLVSGGGTYALGANVSLSATPLAGYLFSNWSEGATNLGATLPLVFPASAARTIKANFVEANPTHVVTTATLPAASTGAPVVYDLATDWSNANNPNGVWRLYRAPEQLFAINQVDYMADGTLQRAWAEQPYPQNAHVPFWMKVTGAPTPGFSAPGTIVMHTAETTRTGTEFSSVTWTSPAAGTVVLAGGAWMNKAFDRPQRWELRLNGVSLTMGDLTQADAFTLANPYSFASGSGGAAAVTRTVQPSDVIELRLYRQSAATPGTSIGLNFSVNFTPVVDPGVGVVVSGAGTYNNGQTATITAPSPVAAGSTEYVFVRFLVNGTAVGATPTIIKTFTTLDPPTLAYVAEYRSQSLKPSVAQITSNQGNPMGATTNLQFILRFDRAMNQAVKPVVELLSSNSSSIPTVPAAGTWTATDTYVVPAIVVGSNSGGLYSVRVSLAQDAQNRVMNPAEVYSFTVDVTPPALPTLAAGAVTATSAIVNWAGYSAPADLASFRVYRSSSTFTSLAGLSPIASLAAAARSYTFTGLDLDTDTFTAVVPVDAMGNAVTAVTPFTVRIPSTVPPLVAFDVAATSTNAARVTWTFDATGQIGFSGFKVYRSSAAFTSIVGLTPIATLADTVRSFAETGLDRAQAYHYAIVAFNRLGQSLTAVSSKPWTDPLSGTLLTNFTASDPLLVITQPLTIGGGATFTVPPGTMVAFGPGASLTVQSGRLVADGTIYAPIVFTSLADVNNGTRTRGAWNGITLADTTRSSTVRNVWIKYGKGLAITGGTHIVDTLGAAWNEVGGLSLSGAVALTTQLAYLSDNAVGARVEGGAALTLTGSVLRNNGVNASSLAGGTLNATGNWWGTADGAAIATSLAGPVNASSPLTGEPILTRGLRSADGAASTGVANLPLQLASLNAAGYRVSEDSSFSGVLFVDVPRNPLSSDLFNTALWPVVVPLSPGGGTKTLYAQFRSPTGVVSPAVSFTTNYITSGPVITAFSLTEGQTINRPITVSGGATSALPLTSITFSVDGVVVATSAASPLSTRWDVLSLTPGVHRVQLAAVDSAGNLASRLLNVVINPTPPPRPVVTSPTDGSRSTINLLSVTGTAEPFGNVQISRNGSVVMSVVASAGGAFTAPNVSFAEGTNEIVASAVDAAGATPSTSVFVNVDSGPPATVTLLPIVYNSTAGLFIDWDLPTSGEVPVLFRVFWHSAPFTSVAQATGQSDATLRTSMNLKTVPDGLRYFAVVGYDDAGNASVLSNLQSYTVDLTPPSFTIGYDQSMPVGPGTLGITVTASEALASAPLLLMRPAGTGLVAVTLTAAGGNTYSASFPVTTLVARTGTAAIGISGTDLAGNAFTGPPAGPALVFDVTKPSGALTTSRSGPIQTTTDVSLSVSLVLSELPKAGTAPTLSFSPPVGSPVPIVLAGSGLNWSGQITLTAAMDNGFGTFLLNVTDAVGNLGTVLTTGEKLELYNTATPSAPAIPSDVTVLPLKGGYIRVSWSAADRAQSYRLYREFGASAAPPTTLVTSDITALSVDDLPPADGAYRYVVTSFRLGAESGPSSVRATTSDRTPPPAPTATTAALGLSGINVGWTPAAAGETPAKFIVYRNSVAIATLGNSATSFVDSPPRGVMSYEVAAADTLGNEAKGPASSIQLFVGAVANLRALVDPAVGTVLSWTSTDATATGYNVYRNGTKQNSGPLTALNFTDALAAGGLPVTYTVTAINAAAQESAARNLIVQPITAEITLNSTAAGEQASVVRYFDNYSIAYTLGAAASQAVTFSGGEIIRAVAGESPKQVLFLVPGTTVAGQTSTVNVVAPAPITAGASQAAAITLTGSPDAGGSAVQYRFVKDNAVAAVAPGMMLSVSVDAQPLAGGLTDLTVQVFNRGYAPADLVLTRGNNTQPGDLEMLIISADGVLVSSTPFQALVSGSITGQNGDAFLRVAPGASVNIPFRGVLVPESLGVQSVTFRARFKAIYNSVGSTQERVAGPLEGSMASSLQVTPYYGTASVGQPAYSDNQPVIITGQALNRSTGLPMPNVPLRIGIRVRGAVIFQPVVTDGAGAYQYSYTPSLGLAGDMVIWAAHPDVVDQLNQARVSFYRMFAKPGRVEAVMSKNDVLDFDISLLNVGDLVLTAPGLSFRAYRIVNNVEVPLTSLTGVARAALPATIAAQGEVKLALRLQAALDAPDDALIEFTFTSAQGASTKLTGTVSLRPALAVLTTVSPTAGYAEAGVGRGQVKSVEVTVQNRGLRALTGVTLVPPAGVPWMQVQTTQAPGVSGIIPLPDIPVGGTRSFTVVFVPPDSTPVGFYNDFLLIKGTNAVGDYRLNLFATVTSEQKGSVLFSVTNSFSNPVPNTSIWLRNSTLGTEVGPVLTDANGRVTVAGLMEGDWQWKTNAAGHGATQGVIGVVPDQTVSVATELALSMVTVKFSVVPVPFTDYYEIKIEQTFQTRTPVPNLILSPPHQTLQVEAGWSGTLLYTLRNEGLRSVFDVVTTGGDLPTMRATPLITFIPELAAQQTVEIPVFFEYFGPPEGSGAAGAVSLADAVRSFSDSTREGKALSSLPVAPARAAAAQAGSVSQFDVPARAAGVIDTAKDIYDCYKEMKYGVITLKSAAFVDSVSGKRYTVGVDATIDVDALLALVCDGECPESWTGSSTAGKIANWACGKIVSKIIEKVSKKTKVIDIVCKAANIIKALACAAAQLPTGQLTGGGGIGGGGSGGPGGTLGGSWSVGGAGCFAAGTQVTLADGTTKAIELLAKGDRLIASSSGLTDSIVQAMALSSDHLRELTFRPRETAHAAEMKLRLTHDHHVWVDGRGWVFAGEVKVGDWLHGVDGKLHEVTGNERLPGRHEVYGLHMGKDNVIYAGGVLTQDQCFKPAATFRASPQGGGAR